ncbi:hypothetical protein ACKLNO_02840 [Neisseriaceae bacterium B1]
MPIKPLLQKFAAIGATLLLFYGAAICGDSLETEPLWILGALMVLCLLLHGVLPRKWARRIFCAWAAMTTFFVLWLVGYGSAMWLYSSCFTDAFGEKRCVMPTGQLLFGFLFALLGEMLILWKLRRFLQPKWERIWQIAALAGLIAGAAYQNF